MQIYRIVLDQNVTVGICKQVSTAKSYELLIAEWVIRLFGAVIIVGGVLGNLVSAYIQGTEPSNRVTTRFLMVCLALTDSLVLLVAVVRYWVTETFELDVRDLHPIICRCHQPIVAIVSDVAVYTLCAMGVERFVSVAFPYRVQQILTKRNLTLAYAIMVLALVGKNAPIFAFLYTTQCARLLNQSLSGLVAGAGAGSNGSLRLLQVPAAVVPSSDYQLTAKCGYNRAFALWFAKLDFVTYLVVPYTILLFCNVYIYIAMRRQAAAMKRHTQRVKLTNVEAVGGPVAKLKTGNNCGDRKKEGARRKPESIMKILAVLTVIHIITTLPASIGQLLKVYGFNVVKSRVTHNAFKTLMFANNATNFLAYFVSSTAFRRRVKALCQSRSSPQRKPAAEVPAEQRRQQQQTPPTPQQQQTQAGVGDNDENEAVPTTATALISTRQGSE